MESEFQEIGKHTVVIVIDGACEEGCGIIF